MESLSCNYCQKQPDKLLTCGACKAVKYCDRECQKSDWKTHKLSCVSKSASNNNQEGAKEKENESKDQKNPNSEPARCKIDDYDQIKQVGVGNFSEIFLVKKKDTGEFFAMKSISKSKVKQLHKENDVVMEKHCLKKLDENNYVIRLYDTFQDDLNLYMVMEYVPQGELWEIVKNFGLESRELIKYFMAHLIQAAEYLHSKGIVHRDLKPENIMLDKNKRIKLVDFGTARDLHNPEVKGSGNSARGRRVFDHFVGTPQYMAPETIRNKDSNYKSDVWSMGCIFYQLIVGMPPFLGQSEYLIFTKSLNERPLYYNFLFDDITRDLIEQMLEKDMDKRISLEKVKEHKFFEGLDFKNIGTYDEAVKMIKTDEINVKEVKDEILKLEESKQNEGEIKIIIENALKKLEESGEFDEQKKQIIKKRLELLMRQAKSHYNLSEFEHKEIA